ncbi:hypothetical protein [Streptomyces sp. A13(2022)]|uniref:hypothetical protein n=1 Tax=Streptomyces sp. A13(2022) TaxID=2964768 RepID=UPI0021D7EC3E|nr:hypothetical protein [Streptomyces sp. A13(2022)]MCU8592153.1 hypothetical protein [Streptomyces sp. A13(2022)]
MPGTFKRLKQEALIDGEWDGLPLDGTLRQLKAGIGACCSSLADAFWITLGAVSVKLLRDAAEQVQALRATVEFDSGVRIITHDLLEREVSFLDTATGEVETLPVVPEGGERSAGSYSVTLMGIPVVETARGSVTLDAVMTLLYLQQAHVGHAVYGGANANDLAVTIEVCFNLLDEEATRLKAHSTAATRRASAKATQLKKALEQRVADGLPTAIEFDTDEARLAKALDAANSEILRLNTELDTHQAILATRSSEQAQAAQRATDTGLDADRAQQALTPLYEARGQARAALERAEEDARPRIRCPECSQLLKNGTGPGPACPLCGQPDSALPERLAAKARTADAARAALAAVEDQLQTAQTHAQQAVDTRRKRSEAVHKAASRTDAYRTAQITPREQARSKAASAAAEYKAALAAVRDRRKELTRLSELERLANHAAEEAERARTAWASAEGDAQHVRQQTAKELSVIYAEKVIPMAPDKIRQATIDPKTFMPKLNGRTVRQLARSAGMINIANNGLHLALLEASRTLPGLRLPSSQWLDGSLDGLGAGDEGALLASRTLAVITATAGADSQLLLATAHDLPQAADAVITEHDSHHPVIPHARTTADDTP